MKIVRLILFVAAVVISFSLQAVTRYAWTGKLGDNISIKLELEQNDFGAIAGQTTYYRKNGKVAYLPVYGHYWSSEYGQFLQVDEYDGNKVCGSFSIVLENGAFKSGEWLMKDKELKMNEVEAVAPDCQAEFLKPIHSLLDAKGYYSFTYETGNPNMPECGGHCSLTPQGKMLSWEMAQVTPNIAEGSGVSKLQGCYFYGKTCTFEFEAYVDKSFVFVRQTNPDAEACDNWGAFSTLQGIYVIKKK